MKIDNNIFFKSEKGKERDIILTGKNKQCFRHFCPAKKCPNSLFAASAPPLWATSKINGDHYRSHATRTLLLHKQCSCLTKRAFSYGSKMSGLTPINGGQENTEGLCCCSGREGASRCSNFSL